MRKIVGEEIQNQCEQEIARNYSLNHELMRPKTNIVTFILWVLGIELISVVWAYIVLHLFHWFGIVFSFSTLYSLFSVVAFFIFLKKICILWVELYQHYASDETRRRCTLMPSCSEYALLALEKYNVFKGLHKIYIRTTTKCKGNYEIDYP